MNPDSPDLLHRTHGLHLRSENGPAYHVKYRQIKASKPWQIHFQNEKPLAWVRQHLE